MTDIDIYTYINIPTELSLFSLPHKDNKIISADLGAQADRQGV